MTLCGRTRAPLGRTLLLAAALVGIAAGLLPTPALGFFGKAKSFDTELRAYSTAVGDLNGDGKPDLAFAGSGGCTVLISEYH